MRDEQFTLIGRQPVLEAYRSGQTVDRLFVQEGLREGTLSSILREARRQSTPLDFVKRSRLDEMSGGENHQGVMAYLAAYRYYEISDMLSDAREKGEDPFLILLDGIEDPHNLGAIIRTANLAGAHGVVIPKRRAAGLTASAAKASAGALNYTKVAKVTNLSKTIEELKKEGIWFLCADMEGESMYRQRLTGPIALVIGNEGFPPGPGELRYESLYPNEGRDRFPERLRGLRRSRLRDRAAEIIRIGTVERKGEETGNHGGREAGGELFSGM